MDKLVIFLYVAWSFQSYTGWNISAKIFFIESILEWKKWSSVFLYWKWRRHHNLHQ